jgi:hypothetical protein
MRQLLCGVAILIGLCNLGFAQDFDSDFRICNGMPASQAAFAMALGGGDLQSAASASLKADVPTAAKVDALYKNLFEPLPNSLIQLNARVDQYVTGVSIDLANQLRAQFNHIVALNLAAAKSGDNIVCSISLLSYREASDVFGKRIANQYGVVQVTIRNTDSAHEFLLHQVDFWFGDTLQYYATRDRRIARGVAEKGQVVDPRNLTIRVLEGVGVVAGATTAIYSSSAQLASSIYSSNFIPAVRSIFPDLTVQQMAKLDDMGFSAGANTMVIPKNGAISFVSFIPADSFLIPKLSQYEQELGPNDGKKEALASCNQFYSDVRMGKNKRPPAETQVMHEQCTKLQTPGRQPIVATLSAATVTKAKGQSTSRSWKTLGMRESKKNMGDYDAAVVLLLQRDLQILVAGSHIQEVTNQPAMSSVSCGSMPVPLVVGSVVTCSITGTRLDQLTQARLINRLDSTQSVPSNGLQTAKDDTTHAQITFPACSFGSVSTDYLLEVTASTGTLQNSTPQNLAPQPETLACIKNPDGSATCQVNGLATGTTAASGTLTGGGSSPKTITLSFGANNSASIAAPLPEKGTYTVAVTTSDGKTAQLCSPVLF